MLDAATASLDRGLGGGKRAAPAATGASGVKRPAEEPSPATSSASTAPMDSPHPSSGPMDTDAAPFSTPPGQKPPVYPCCLNDDAVHDLEACSG